MPQLPLSTLIADVPSVAALTRQLDELWTREPSLRPNPDLHDYQLTYPPAVQLEVPAFRHTPADEQFVKQAVGDLRAAGYYFHFGFCQYRCRYCFHYELTTKLRDERMRRYVDALDREMARFRQLAPTLKPGLFFLGGGTPSALPVELLQRFLESLHRHFGPPPTKLSTVEVKPITATEEKLTLLVQAGFRRINLGVQTLDKELYAFHHQKEDLEVAYRAIALARKVGFEYINIDLMTGLESQTPESWQITLTALHDLADSGAVDSIFLYPFHDDPRSRTYSGQHAVPNFYQTAHSDAQARALMQGLGWRELGARFYRAPRHVHREVLELARMRINPAYGEALYHGFGNSSFSVGDRATYLNHRTLEDYCAAVEAGGPGIAYFTTLTDGQRAARDVTFDLLYSPITRVRSRGKKYGEPAMALHRTKLARWVELGLGSFNRLLGTFSLSPLGKLVHQQMIPHHYLPGERTAQDLVMIRRKEAGKAYRGY